MNLKTRIRSTMMRLFTSEGYQRSLRRRRRLMRKLSGGAAIVHYFHQVDDPYSHLALQKLEQLKAAYNLPFKMHLVSKPAAEFQGNSERFDNWALRDALSIAADYGTSLQVSQQPEPGQIQTANNLLTPCLEQDDFVRTAIETGEALWSGQLPADGSLSSASEQALNAGNALRTKLGHYLGGMFCFEGEWFWGIDRIRSLEQRLIEEGYGVEPLCVPEPTPVDTTGFNADQIVLEYFPSLRSPYTAVGHQGVLGLIARSGVTVKLRPVMPMLMRGVPAPFSKQRYIISDATREARARNVPFGRIVDPFGEPVKRAFALFPAAMALDKGMDFVTAYLSAAWAEGVDITQESGLQYVAGQAGIDWQSLQDAKAGTDWETVLDDNLNAMLGAGLWGVPSFRVSGGNDDASFACWGQDRLWRVENEIAKRADR
ncbi:MAG: DsbA family protein [Pseudomonadota bacterium]